MKHKVAEIEGALLDTAVAKAEGLEIIEVGHKAAAVTIQGAIAIALLQWAPSTNWNHAGPIIARERIELFPSFKEDKEAPDWFARLRENGEYSRGPTPLIAAMRAYVASKFGNEVEL